MNETTNNTNDTQKSDSPRRRTHHARVRTRNENQGGARKRTPGNRNNRPGGRGGNGASKTTKKSSRKRSGNRHPRRKMTSPALKHRLTTSDAKSPKIPDIKDENTVRIIPMSGVEEIGRNMNIIETKDDIIVIDAGFQFVSEGSHAPGINYILPNTQYLEERKHKIRALVITHGHLDHIGGIPFVMERIGNPPIYTQYLTSLMVKKRQEEFPHMDPLTINEVKEGESFTVGSTTIKTFPVTHSIPDAMGIAIETPHGDVVVTGDIRLSHENGDVIPEEKKSWEEVGKNNNLVMLADSTNADRDGFSAPESIVFESLETTRLIRLSSSLPARRVKNLPP
jgi:glyoxylase-like metal-dependent hydrolase (beta-lactamase superfamily II)